MDTDSVNFLSYVFVLALFTYFSLRAIKTRCEEIASSHFFSHLLRLSKWIHLISVAQVNFICSTTRTSISHGKT